MDPQRTPPRRDSQLQGPRPAPLRITKDSHQIRKPPIAPKSRAPHVPPQMTPNQPVIIYSVSPKPIHVDPTNFMSIVQQLTGKDSNFTYSSSSSRAGDAPPSPAARLAAIERTSPTEKEARERRYRGCDLGDEIDVEVGPMQGILSPAPVNLPEITPEMFAPMNDGFGLGLGFGPSEWLNMSPFMRNGNGLYPSPSTMLFDATNNNVPSPGPDFFNLFDFS